MSDCDKSVEYYFNSGMIAHEHDYPRDSCSFLFDAWPRQAWMMGWDFRDLQQAVLNRTVPLGERTTRTPLEQGGIAHSHGVALYDAPYGPDTQDARQWRLGWRQADGDKPYPEAKLLGRVIGFVFCLAICAAFVAAIYFAICY